MDDLITFALIVLITLGFVERWKMHKNRKRLEQIIDRQDAAIACAKERQRQ